MFKVKKYTILGGLKVVLVNIASSPTTTVEVLVETGSKYESKREAGLSHFLEHMCFKGTTRRPSALAVSKALDELGAISNAFTSTEVTAYWAKASHEHTLEIIDIIADLYVDPIFKAEDLEKEKGVITEEINMYLDRPQDIVNELFDFAMHGDQPAGRPVIGNKKSISSFKIKDFSSYRTKHYVAKATTIVIAGHFNERGALAAIKRGFSRISHASKHGKERTEISHRSPRVVHKYKDTDQAHIILGLRSFPYKDSRNAVMSVITGILSSGMSSRLFHRLREELGICYYVRAYNVPSTDHGEFGVASGVDPKRIDVAVHAIMDELKKLKSELVPKDELDKVKTSLISKLRMSLETSESVLDYFAGRSVFHKDLKSPSDLEEMIAKVKAEDVRELAKKVFRNEDLVLALVSKTADKSKLRKLLKF